MLQKIQKIYLLPSCMILGMICVVYAVSGLFPFGAKTISWGDMTQQVLPFMVQFKDIAAGRDGVLLNMANAGGMNFWGVFLFFISSPFTLLGLFVPREYFYHFANILVLLKMIAAGCAATAYFAGKHSIFRCSHWQAGLLGVLYAFGGFTLLYYQNVVWLDQLILFPLVMIALDMLLTDGKILPFSLSLSASIFNQFQIGYIMIFAVLFSSFFYMIFFAKPGQTGKNILKLAGAALLSAATTAVVWLPVFFQFSVSARSNSVIDNLKASLLLAHGQTTLPMVLCTAGLGGAIIFLCFKKRFATPGAIYAFSCFCLFAIPLVIEPINMMWHAGSYQAFPSRYGFLPLFFGLVLLSACFKDAEALPAPQYSTEGALAASLVGILVACSVFLFVLLFYREEADAYVRSLWGNLKTLQWALICFVVGAVAYCILLCVRANKRISQQVFILFLCALVALEGMYNGMLYIGSAAHETASYQMAMDLSGRLGNENTGRVKMSRKYINANDIGAMGYSSVAHYSSLTRTDYMFAQKKLGYSGYWMELSGVGGTDLSDNFLGINTTICQRDSIDPSYTASQVVYQNDWYALVNNPLVPQKLSGFVVSNTVPKIAAIPEGDRFMAQDWLYKNIYAGTKPLYTRYEPDFEYNASYNFNPVTGFYNTVLYNPTEKALFQYTIDVAAQETLYFDCLREISNSLSEGVYNSFAVSVNGIYVEGEYPNGWCNGLLNLGTFEEEAVTIQIEVLRGEWMRSFGVVGIQKQQVADAVRRVVTQPLAVRGNMIDVEAQGTEGQLLVLPIAFDEGFSATINGEPVEVHKVLDSFMAIRLQTGQNSIRLRFLPRGFVLGALLSILCLAGIVFLLIRKKIRKNYFPKHLGYSNNSRVFYKAAERISSVLFVVVVCAAFVALYILPLCFWLMGKRAFFA